MNSVPFSEACQLNHELKLDNSEAIISLQRTDPSLTTLPGQARVELRSSDLDEYLRREFLVPQLDQLAPKLWLVSPKFQLNRRAEAARNLTCFLCLGVNSSEFTRISLAPSNCSGPGGCSRRKPTAPSDLEIRHNFPQTYSKILVVVCFLAIFGSAIPY